MKKIVSVLLCFTLLVGMTACNQQKKIEEPNEVVEVDTVPKEKDLEQEIESEIKETAADNMIQNPNFTEGVGKWMTYLNDGEASLKVNEEGQLVIDIADTGTLDYSVQAYYDGIVLEQGVVYKFAFDMAVSTPRTVIWRIQLNGGDYSSYFFEEIAATAEMQHYEYEFKMEQPSDPAPRLCFNVGYYEADGKLSPHAIMLDNFEYYILDESGKVSGQEGDGKPDINVNQVGYLPTQSKKATFRGENIGTEFEVINVESGESVFSGKIQEEGENASSQENCAVGDFSALATEGTYKIVNENCGESYEFKIASNVYDTLLQDTLRMLYMQRCGQDLSDEFAGDFAHVACHTGEAVVYGTDTMKEVSGGWHDAGDYGRYVVSGAKAVADLLLAYEAYPEVFGDDLNIPESGNGIPDILDEVRYELEWMLKMQEENGGVYHKVTCNNFPGTIWPQDETDQLVIAPISNTATADFAAVMAMASRTYMEIDNVFAATCMYAAQDAMEYLYENQDAGAFKNPTDIVTGEYPDETWTDEYFWALAEMYKSTGEVSYEDEIKKCDLQKVTEGLGWQGVGYYGMTTYLSNEDADGTFQSKVATVLENAVNAMDAKKDVDAYNATLGAEYPWGSNMTIANNGMLYLMTGHLSEAESQLTYLLGNNTNSYCFVTGYGTLSPQGTHHRPSQVLKRSMVGMLVGGPNSNLEDPYAQATLKDKPAAKCYVDNEQSYSCNEVAIYWNSPLIYLVAGICEGNR